MSNQENQNPQGAGPQGQPPYGGQPQQPMQGQAYANNAQAPYGQPGQQPYYAQPGQAYGQMPQQPQQPAKKKGGCLKAFLIALGVIVALSLLASIFGGGSESSSGSSSASSGKSESAQSSNSKAKDPNSLSVGDTLTLDNGLTVTVDKCKTVSSYGNSYVGIQVTYKNTGSDSASFNLLDWQGEDKDGALENADYTTFDNQLSSGDLKAGGKKTAWVYLPKGSKKAVYSANSFWSNEPDGTWKLK